jgi:transcription initiation factor TFIID TATA-box-binding protein
VPAYTYNVVNVVATVMFGRDLDLDAIMNSAKAEIYPNPMLASLVVRLDGATALVFRSGKAVISGAKSIRDVARAVKRLAEIFRDAGIAIGKAMIVIQNIVVQADFGANINLDLASLLLEGDVLYEPEQFPGIVLRLEDPKATALIFASGRAIIAGLRREEDIAETVEKIYNELQRAESLIPREQQIPNIHVA